MASGLSAHTHTHTHSSTIDVQFSSIPNPNLWLLLLRLRFVSHFPILSFFRSLSFHHGSIRWCYVISWILFFLLCHMWRAFNLFQLFYLLSACLDWGFVMWCRVVSFFIIILLFLRRGSYVMWFSANLHFLEGQVKRNSFRLLKQRGSYNSNCPLVREGRE